MREYFVKTPWWLKKIYPGYTWDINTAGRKEVYLSFDDGPHPIATPFVLDLLKQYEAQASFFCIGKNVKQHPKIYQRILAEGHAVGNHTMNHLNGWKTDRDVYIDDTKQAAAFIDSSLFRPPYGRIKSSQARVIPAVLSQQPARIIMWDVLSADFDERLTGDQCASIVIKHARPGSIIVFHDSQKAMKRLEIALEKVLRYFKEENVEMRAL